MPPSWALTATRFYGAPPVLVVLADTACGTYQYDGSLVMGNLLNAAASWDWAAAGYTAPKRCSPPPKARPCCKNGRVQRRTAGRHWQTASSAIPRRKGRSPPPRARKAMSPMCAETAGSLASGPTCASPPAWSAACSARRFCTAFFRRRSRRCSPRAAARPAGRPPPPLRRQGSVPESLRRGGWAALRSPRLPCCGVESGAPYYALSGAAAAWAAEKRLTAHLSLSHDGRPGACVCGARAQG